MAAPDSPARSTAVQFDRDILPILSDKCFLCHGPDAGSREADLRLDTQAGLFETRGEVSIVVPDHPEQSELLRRVLSSDELEQMPPPDSNLALSATEKQLLQDWIQAGAIWTGHWAFEPILRPQVPKSATGEKLHPIDVFVRQQLTERNLAPAPPAEKARLLRRVKFDLTGLPPTLAELDQFLADDSAEAYAHMVDRFLALPAYGERLAWNWLDVARYADTNGYQGDRTRTMWPWRDWVIEAFNSNLPYDRFTVQQLAGDLLPDSTAVDKLATGFCRNHMINGEGGRIAEENRVEYVFDQTETMGTVWLGLTLNCCRCHDHKYDPLSQAEYFQFFDFFNQTPVTGAGGDPQMAPNLKVPSASQEQQLQESAARLATLRSQLRQREQELEQTRSEWEAAQQAKLSGQSAWVPLKPDSAVAVGQTLTVDSAGRVLATGDNPLTDSYTLTAPLPEGLHGNSLAALRLDAIRHPTMTKGGLARSDSGNFVLTDLVCELLPPDGEPIPLEISAASATHEQGGLKITNAFDDNPRSGWAVLQGAFVDRDHAGIFVFRSPPDIPAGTHLRVRLDFQSVHAHHQLGHFLLSVTADPQAPLQDESLLLTNALLTPPAERTDSQRQLIHDRLRQADTDWQKMSQSIKQAEDARKKIEQAIPVVMIMSDQPQRRSTFLLEKGLYNKTLGPAAARFPQAISLPEVAADRPLNRLDLARWLVDPQHPLTARVTVNRYWQMLFGRGLVSTANDFGRQGSRPSHPELLDWLAAEFIESGWNVKQLLRTIVTSETYRQSAAVDPQAYAADPDNIWLARGPRSRLPAWMLRDHALAASGLLVDTLGGPSVNPYQPEGIWAEATFGKIRYTQDHGEKLYRRTLYTFWRRIVGPTNLFDNSPRQACSVEVYRTNTPLHALTTLNDITYVEAARGMAAQLLQTAGDDANRIEHGFRLATSRVPEPRERELLTRRLTHWRSHFADHPKEAVRLRSAGESPVPADIPAAEHAAWTALCSLLLNLDEALTH